MSVKPSGILKQQNPYTIRYMWIPKTRTKKTRKTSLLKEASQEINNVLHRLQYTARGNNYELFFIRLFIKFPI